MVTIAVSFTCFEFLVIFIVEEMPVISVMVFCCFSLSQPDCSLIMVTQMLVAWLFVQSLE